MLYGEKAKKIQTCDCLSDIKPWVRQKCFGTSLTNSSSLFSR